MIEFSKMYTTDRFTMSKYHPDQYDPLISDLKAGLEVALNWTENSVSGPDQMATHTSRNDITRENFVGVNEDLLWVDKLAVAAIREIDQIKAIPTDTGELPLIYSWYRYGRATPIGAIKPENLEPGRIDQRATGNPYKSSFDEDFPSAEDFAHFFQDKIESMNAFEANLYDFLQEDYSDAPKKIESAYLSNLQLQESLFNLFNLTAGSILNEPKTERIVSNTEGAISDFERAVYREEFVSEETTDHVINYLNNLRDLMLGIKSFDGMVQHAQERLFHEFVTEYHGSVWMWVARVASTETVDDQLTGAEDLEDDNQDFIKENKQYWKGQVENLETSMQDANLSPDISSYGREIDKETKRAIEPIENAFLG